MAREIQLTKGYVAIVDDEDFAWLSEFSWFASESPAGVYAMRWNGALRRNEYMHRLILGAAAGQVVDHADRDRLNNRRKNLRFCEVWQNRVNAKMPRRSAPYRGIFFDRRDGKWRASLTANGRRYNSARMTEAEAAARAYDALAREHHGEFAIMNFPPNGG